MIDRICGMKAGADHAALACGKSVRISQRCDRNGRLVWIGYVQARGETEDGLVVRFANKRSNSVDHFWLGFLGYRGHLEPLN